MREVNVKLINEKIYEAFSELCFKYEDDTKNKIEKAYETSTGREKKVLELLMENEKEAYEKRVPLCQDTGMAVVKLEIGQDVHMTDGNIAEAVNEAVRKAYKDSYLRLSVVDDPLFERKNTKDNTPALITYEIVPGDKVKVYCMAKGFGSENMSRVKMLVPADGEAGVIDFVVDAVRQAGPNPCPPVIVGVGIGGTMEQAALLAKRMTARALDSVNPDPRYAALEDEILRRINQLGIGPAGIGGRCTALKVNIAAAPTHIAGMPAAVNMCCHAARHAHTVL